MRSRLKHRELEFNDIPVGAGNGRRLGILGTGGTLITRVEIVIPEASGYDGDGGAEGLTGDALVYRGQPLPIPSTGLLIALGLTMLFRGYRGGPKTQERAITHFSSHRRLV